MFRELYHLLLEKSSKQTVFCETMSLSLIALCESYAVSALFGHTNIQANTLSPTLIITFSTQTWLFCANCCRETISISRDYGHCLNTILEMENAYNFERIHFTSHRYIIAHSCTCFLRTESRQFQNFSRTNFKWHNVDPACLMTNQKYIYF